jgi:uncharacterized protein (UPF0333 family)
MKYLHNHKKGQAATEFALIAPVFFLLILGMFDFGRMFQAYLTFSHASKEAVRYASLNAQDGSGIRSIAINQIANGSYTINPQNVVINYRDPSSNKIIATCPPGCGPPPLAAIVLYGTTGQPSCPSPRIDCNIQPGDTVEVTVSLPFYANTLLIQNLLPKNFAVNSTTVTTIEK